jgi:4-hydroxy-tetrahydrodipicolinate reductase
MYLTSRKKHPQYTFPNRFQGKLWLIGNTVRQLNNWPITPSHIKKGKNGDRMGKINAGLFGFGRTGRIVALELMKDPEIELKWVVRHTQTPEAHYASDAFDCDIDEARIYSNLELDINFFRENPVDVIVDFSAIDGYQTYIGPARELGIKVVSAISNYPEEVVKELRCAAKDTTVLYSPNITLGINFLLIAAEALHALIPYADIEIIEEHFRDKKDPSGTAIKMAKLLQQDPARAVHSVRAGGIIGHHEVIFGLPYQTIRLSHDSISKSAFGQGAIFALKQIVQMDGGFHTMEELLRGVIRENLSTLKEEVLED